jgi:hypothetical protein
MKKELTKKQIQDALGNIKADFAFEGLNLTSKEMKITEKILNGTITAEEAIKNYIKAAGFKYGT